MKRINLLPPEQRVNTSRERSRLFAVIGLVVLVVALGAVYYQQMSTANAKQEELDGITAETQVVAQQVAALRPYVQIHDLRSAMNETSRAIYDARVPWSTILEEVSLVIPDNVRLSSMSCTVPDVMRPGAAGTATKSEASTDITFSGDTYSHKDVAEFMTRLGLVPQLTNIQLASSTGSESTAGTTRTVSFSVTASLRAYVVAPPSTLLGAGGTP